LSDYRVQLDIFAGPLDLLLYLVRKEEVDIYDIPIARITAQYIRYIQMLKSLDIDLAGEFLVMAATLMQIKSAMLLPRSEPEPDQADESEDPRRELIRQLLEYKKFKDAANLLDEASRQQDQRHSRPATIVEQLKQDDRPEIDVEQVSVWDLVEAFDAIMRATGGDADFRYIDDETPIDLYQIEILHQLQTEGPMTFERIFEGKAQRLVLVGLFLALLELIREGLVWAQQPASSPAIYLRALAEEPAEEAVHKAVLAAEPDAEESASQSEERRPAIEIVELPAKGKPKGILEKPEVLKGPHQQQAGD